MAGAAPSCRFQLPHHHYNALRFPGERTHHWESRCRKYECTWLLIKIEANCWQREVSVRARHNTRGQPFERAKVGGEELSELRYFLLLLTLRSAAAAAPHHLASKPGASFLGAGSALRLLTRATLRFFSPLSWSRAITRRFKTSPLSL